MRSGDTLGGIAARYHTSWQHLASYNHISNPNVIYVSETICVPGQAAFHPGRFGSGSSGGGQQPPRGKGNPFPYGQCTWYANQRYYQLPVARHLCSLDNQFQRLAMAVSCL
ncbi:MAG: LysM peptidoglycan-binding domain-containing protein [Ktedonobacteraceae bacterium]